MFRKTVPRFTHVKNTYGKRRHKYVRAPSVKLVIVVPQCVIRRCRCKGMMTLTLCFERNISERFFYKGKQSIYFHIFDKENTVRNTMLKHEPD